MRMVEERPWIAVQDSTRGTESGEKGDKFDSERSHFRLHASSTEQAPEATYPYLARLFPEAPAGRLPALFIGRRTTTTPLSFALCLKSSHAGNLCTRGTSS